MADAVLRRKALCPLPLLMYHPEVLDWPHHIAAPYSPGNIMGWGTGIPARDHNLYCLYSNSVHTLYHCFLKSFWGKKVISWVLLKDMSEPIAFFIRSKLDIRNGAQGKMWRLRGEAKERYSRQLSQMATCLFSLVRHCLS